MKQKLTVERVRELFRYDPETGVVTFTCKRGRARAGAQAGSIKSRGYVEIQVDGQMVRRSRLAWALFHGQWPRHQIDHINRVRNDDRICNLRDVTAFENMHNQGLTRSNNTTGVVGVSFNKRQSKYVASVYVNGRCIFLGQFVTLEEAAQARARGKALHHANTQPPELLR